MISDTLSDAATEIRAYLEVRPDDYRHIEPRLQRLLAEMDAVRVLLNTPPSGEIDLTISEALLADAKRLADHVHAGALARWDICGAFTFIGAKEDPYIQTADEKTIFALRTAMNEGSIVKIGVAGEIECSYIVKTETDLGQGTHRFDVAVLPLGEST